jgi:hypothetical protein
MYARLLRLKSLVFILGIHRRGRTGRRNPLGGFGARDHHVRTGLQRGWGDVPHVGLRSA